MLVDSTGPSRAGGPVMGGVHRWLGPGRLQGAPQDSHTPTHPWSLAETGEVPSAGKGFARTKSSVLSPHGTIFL